MSKQIKHLELLQGIINRMAHCSFLLKGWSVVLVAGIFALAARDVSSSIAALAFFPVLVFWALDAYYLMLERHYRRIYDRVRSTNEASVDFSMDTAAVAKSKDWPSALVSPTLLCFHGAIILTVALVWCLLILGAD